MHYKVFRHKMTRATLSKKVCSRYWNIPAMKMDK